MNGFSNDWFGSAGFRTMGAGVNEVSVRPAASFTPWSHGGATPRVGTPAEMPAPRLEAPNFGPARSFAPMQQGEFLGSVRLMPGNPR